MSILHRSCFTDSLPSTFLPRPPFSIHHPSSTVLRHPFSTDRTSPSFVHRSTYIVTLQPALLNRVIVVVVVVLGVQRRSLPTPLYKRSEFFVSLLAFVVNRFDHQISLGCFGRLRIRRLSPISS